MKEYLIHQVLSITDDVKDGFMVVYEVDGFARSTNIWQDIKSMEDPNRDARSKGFVRPVKFTDGESKIVFDDDNIQQSSVTVYLKRAVPIIKQTETASEIL